MSERISTAYLLFSERQKLRHSPGRPSRSDFVQFEFAEDIDGEKI